MGQYGGHFAQCFNSLNSLQLTPVFCKTDCHCIKLMHQGSNFIFSRWFDSILKITSGELLNTINQLIHWFDNVAGINISNNRSDQYAWNNDNDDLHAHRSGVSERFSCRLLYDNAPFGCIERGIGSDHLYSVFVFVYLVSWIIFWDILNDTGNWKRFF